MDHGFAGVAVTEGDQVTVVANFFFIPFYPFWAILIIALDIWVIWALTRHVEKVQDL